MDPLSDVLSLLKPASYAFRGLDAGGVWSIGFEAVEGIKCYALYSGACWVKLDSQSAPVLLQAGDFFMLPTGQAFRLYSDAEAEPVDAEALFSTFPAGEMAVFNGGVGCSGVGGYFDFVGPHAGRLLALLPPIVHIRAEANKAPLRASIERLMCEMRNPQPGSAIIAGHFAQALLVEALRLHLAERWGSSSGWLFALADRRMHTVIAAMHAAPGRRWTLQDLALVAGMSRSTFAARFKTTVGEPAMVYLTRWRMMLAADRLTKGGFSISTVAPAVGYESESAFSAAFKRVIGRSPREFLKSAA
jgi:AraC-like DNA-binding protein